MRGGNSFNSNFLQIPYQLNSEKKIKIGPTLSKLQGVKVGGELLTHL